MNKDACKRAGCEHLYGVFCRDAGMPVSDVAYCGISGEYESKGFGDNPLKRLMLTILVLLCVFTVSCATHATTSTPRKNIHLIHATGGVAGVGTGILGIASGNPLNMLVGVFDLFSSSVAFNNAVNEVRSTKGED